MTPEEIAALTWLRSNNADVTFRENGAKAYIVIGRKSSQRWDLDLIAAAKVVGWPGMNSGDPS